MNPSTPFSKPTSLSDSPFVTVVEINDPTAIGEAMELVEQDVVQLDSRPLRFRRIIVRLKTAMVVHQSTNGAGRGLNKLQDGHVAFVAFGPRAAGTINGMALGPDRVMASPSGIEVEFVVAPGYESTSFLLPGDEFDAHFKSRARKHERFSLQDVQLLQTGLVSARRLYSFGRRLTDLAARRPDLLENPETRSAAEGELFDTLFSTILSSAPSRTTAQDRTRQAYSQLVRVAQRHALEHTAGPVRMLELCEATGVSERTLQNAFKQVLGMSPVTYLNRLRLHRARSALRAAAFGSTTVIEVALRWGFWHVSDFSQAYKRCFGELPSETLRRQELDRGISGRGNCSGRH